MDASGGWDMVALLRNKWFWAVAFGALFALSIDVWAWDWTGAVFLGIPYTVVYIAVLEAALFVLYVLFARYYWTESEEGA
jgi:hypothetical protein